MRDTVYFTLEGLEDGADKGSCKGGSRPSGLVRPAALLAYGKDTVPPPTLARTPVVPGQDVAIPRATRTAR